MEVMNARIKRGVFASLSYLLVDLFSSFIHHLFNARRMYSSIDDELLKRYPCDLSPYRVKSRKDNSFRSIINNQIYACSGFKSADIPALSSDNTPFHLIVG